MSGTEITYQCEQCGDDVPEADAYTQPHPGYGETVTLAFCPGCTQ